MGPSLSIVGHLGIRAKLRTWLTNLAVLPVLGVAFFVRKRRKVLVWGPVPTINIKYWSAALAEAGWESVTLVRSHFSRYGRDDFDLLYDDLPPSWLPLKAVWGPALAFLFIIRNASVVHIPFSGGPLGTTVFWRFEGRLYRLFGIRIVAIPYGADVWRLSRVAWPCVRHVSLVDYPNAAVVEERVSRRMRHWTRFADCIICGNMYDGIPRWDVLTVNALVIDCDSWRPENEYSKHDGKNGEVTVLHSPNHRASKGTEFLIAAVEKLRAEGWLIKLQVLENMPNVAVREAMQSADIMAESFIFGYGMSAVEGMASGLPVMSNLDDEHYRRIHRRYAYLAECPILSTSPETIERNLRLLVSRPDIREALGKAGREYVEKYHSYETAAFMFSTIYRRLLNSEAVDLINMFHPVLGAFPKSRPVVQHPLSNGRFLDAVDTHEEAWH